MPTTRPAPPTVTAPRPPTHLGVHGYDAHGGLAELLDDLERRVAADRRPGDG